MGSMSTQTITEFLAARIADDEAMARQEDEDYADTTLLPTYDSEHQAAWNTTRVLAECAAKRAIMSHYTETVKWARDPDCPAVQSYSDIAVGLGESLRHLASVYKDHPDYQQDWAL